MYDLLLYFIVIILCGVSLWWFYFTRTKLYKFCRKIPGPVPIPVIGNTHQILKMRKDFVRNFLAFAKNNYPICRAFVLQRCVILLQDADHIHAVMHSSKTISRPTEYSFISPLLGYNSVFCAKRNQWRRYRSVMNKVFKIPEVRAYITVISEKSQSLVESMKKQCDGKKFNVHSHMCAFTSDLIFKTVMGDDAVLNENSRKDLLQCLEEGRLLMQNLLLSPWYRIKFLYEHSELSANIKNILKRIHSVFDPFVNAKARKSKDERAVDITRGKNENCKQNKCSGFLDHAFDESRKDADAILTAAEIFDQVVTLMVAGTDTCGYTLSVCLMLLGLHKDIQDKVFVELRDIFRDDVSRSVQHDDIERMTYTEQVIKETLRLFPVAFIIGRSVEEDIEIGEYYFPAGSDILISPYLLHRDAKYFPDPLKFDPDRFSSENSNKRHPHAFIPFASGIRICVGYYYAMVEMKIALAHILRNFEILPCGSREAMEEIDMSIMISLKHGYNIRMKNRFP